MVEPDEAPRVVPAGTSREHQLLAFCSAEISGFFGYLSTAVAGFSESGSLPQPQYGASAKVATAQSKKAAKKAKNGAADKPKRPPSSFNMYVARKMAAMKESGFVQPENGPRNALFSAAVAEWNKLTAEQKQKFSEEYKAHVEANTNNDASELAQPPQQPALPLAEPVDGEEKKRKKKKRKLLEGEAAAAAAPAAAPAALADGTEKKKKKKKHKALDAAQTA